MRAAFDPRPAHASATGPNAVGQVPLTRMAAVELDDYRRFRADGWPYCPRCDEDELYSLAEPATVETICGCYRCGPWPSAFEMGSPRVNAVSGYCCGKPVGCTNPDPRCVYLQHPWKREQGIGQ